MLRLIPEIDEILRRRVFREVLRTHGARRPVLERVRLRVPHGAYYCAVEVWWSLEPQIKGHPREDIHQVASVTVQPGSALARLNFGSHDYDATRVWSEVYEAHYLREMERGADRVVQALAAAAVVGHRSVPSPGVLEYLRSSAQQVREHARQFHRDVRDLDEGTHLVPQQPDETFATDGHTFTATYPATVVHVRRDEPVPEPLLASLRAVVDEHARQMMEDIRETLGAGAMTSTSPASMTVATLQETMVSAIEALGQRPTRQQAEPFPEAPPVSGTTVNDDPVLLMRWLVDLFKTTPAEERAMALFREHLTPEQRKSYDERASFEVRGGTTGRRYRIQHGRQMNIAVLDDQGRAVQGLCFVPEGALPTGDCMLAQKLALELDEERALAVANEF